VRNSSLWLDLKIAGLTVLFMLRGERSHAAANNEAAIGLEPHTKAVP
jgi:hypothetical protein